MSAKAADVLMVHDAVRGEDVALERVLGGARRVVARARADGREATGASRRSATR